MNSTATAGPRVPRPAATEYFEYYGRYIAQVEGDDALTALANQIESTTALLRGVDAARAEHRYAPGKWSVKEVIIHLSDAERVFGYRALRFGRGDETPLPGFDENQFALAWRADHRAFAEVAEEFRSVRAATLSLFRSFDAQAIAASGEASGRIMSVRALAWVAAGHERHHVALLRERYGLGS